MKLYLTALMGLMWTFLLFQPIVNAQVVNPENKQINLNNFFGVYNLSKASNGSSLLTAEETVLADFPNNANFYGLTRTLQSKYQGHNVDINVLNVVDAASNPIPYKTSSDTNGNYVITTGDPSVTLFGPQTIKIRYQTHGVINLNGKNDEFLLNVNGLGWSSQFGSVSAVVNIANNLNAQLVGNPTCYINTGKSTNQNCSISKSQKQGTTVLTSKSGPVPANQALVLKMSFKPSTFKQYSSWSTKKILFIALPILVVSTLGAYFVLSKRKSTT